MKIVVKDWLMLSVGERRRILQLKWEINQYRLQKLAEQKRSA